LIPEKLLESHILVRLCRNSRQKKKKREVNTKENEMGKGNKQICIDVQYWDSFVVHMTPVLRANQYTQLLYK